MIKLIELADLSSVKSIVNCSIQSGITQCEH